MKINDLEKVNDLKKQLENFIKHLDDFKSFIVDDDENWKLDIKNDNESFQQNKDLGYGAKTFIYEILAETSTNVHIFTKITNAFENKISLIKNELKTLGVEL